MRVRTLEVFRARVTGRLLTGEGLVFTIHSDGRISGRADGLEFSGAWLWRDGLFCRTAELDGIDLGADCEVIEVSGPLMRYTRNEGEGSASIVTIGHPAPA